MHPNRKFMVLLSAVLALGGCGGGGNGPAPDTIPDKFTFKPVDDAQPGKPYTGSVKITGINANAPLSIEGGSFSLDGKDFISSLGAVSNNDTVTVRVTAAETYDTEVKATLTVGGVAADFVVRTVADVEAPRLAVHFPPPHALTDAPLPATLTVRGAVEDNVGVTAVYVNDVSAELEAESGTWVFDYEIEAGEQVLSVVAEDVAGNRSLETIVTLTHVPSTDTGNFGTGAGLGTRGVAFVPARDSVLYAFGSRIAELDLANGQRDFAYEPEEGEFAGGFWDFVHDPATDTVYGATYIGEHLGVGRIDLATGTGIALSVKGDGKGDDSEFRIPRSVAVVESNATAYLITSNQAYDASYLWSVDTDTGERRILSMEPYSALNARIRFHSESQRLLVADYTLYAVPLDGSERDVLIDDQDFRSLHLSVNPMGTGVMVYGEQSEDVYTPVLVSLEDIGIVPTPGAGLPAFGPELRWPHGFDVDWQRNIAYVATDGDNEYGLRITAVDMETGYRVIVAMEH